MKAHIQCVEVSREEQRRIADFMPARRERKGKAPPHKTGAAHFEEWDHTTSEPYGSAESFISLKHCLAKGMPMMVMQRRPPTTAYETAI